MDGASHAGLVWDWQGSIRLIRPVVVPPEMPLSVPVRFAAATGPCVTVGGRTNIIAIALPVLTLSSAQRTRAASAGKDDSGGNSC